MATSEPDDTSSTPAAAADFQPQMVTRLFAPALIDDEPLLKPEPEKARRRRGRPPGSKTQVAHAHVTADEFAVLRAIAQGVDIAVAARQFMLWPGRVPERPALLKIYDELLRRVEAGALALPESKVGRQMVRSLLNLQTVVTEDSAVDPAGKDCPAQAPALDLASASASAPAPSPVVAAPEAARQPPRPTIEEFAAQFDEDMYGEAELLELYESEYPVKAAAASPVPVPPSARLTTEQAAAQQSSAKLPSAAPDELELSAMALEAKSAQARIKIQLDAINWLDDRLGRRPNREHLVDQWVRLNEDQRDALRKAGVLSLGNLVDWISLRGDAWVKSVPGYGLARGQNLLQWLKRWEIQPSEGLKRIEVPAGSAARSLAPVTGPGALMSPLAKDWPVALNGEFGTFRSHHQNSLSAKNDQEAVQAWFRLLKDKSPHTQVVYRRAIERLILWAVNERKMALSSLSELDMQDFKAFLCNPPPHWVKDPQAQRGRKAASWRPLKGPLNQTSLNVTFAAVSALYAHWMESRYTTVNPARKLIGKRTDELTMDVMRSFTDHDLDVIARTFEDMEDGPVKRRLRAILLLLELGGLRREEACKATWAQVQRVRIDGRLTEYMCLDVLGKGNRQRFVPLNDVVLGALRDHLQDRKALMAEGKMTQFQSIPDKDQPLLGVLDDRWIVTQDKQLAKLSVSDAADSMPVDENGVRKFTVNKNGALSVQSVYQILKEFFRRCSVTAGESATDELATFKRASTHWLRHTFAHQLLKETDRDLALVQAVLGHKSITTTAIYVKADLEARVNGVKRLRGSV